MRIINGREIAMRHTNTPALTGLRAAHFAARTAVIIGAEAA